MAKRELNPAEIRAATRLRNLYLRHNKATGVTQVELAEKVLGIKQATLNQYLNGVIPIGLEILLQFADIFNVLPEDIYPEKITNIRPILQRLQEKIIPVMGTLSGNQSDVPQIAVMNLNLPQHCYAVSVDTEEYSEVAPRGTFLLVNPMGLLRPGARVVFCFVKEAITHYVRLVEITADHLHYTDMCTGKKHKQPLTNICKLHAVCGEQYPPI